MHPPHGRGIPMFLSLANRRRFSEKLATFFLVLFFLVLKLPNAFADDNPTIFDVRRSLPMEPSEPTFHDFYINAGPEVGFRVGMVMNVIRSMPVHDPIQNKQQATLNITVGKVRVIHVEKGIAVARLVSEVPSSDRPVLDFESVMIGDQVDLTSMKMQTTEAKPELNINSDPLLLPVDRGLPIIQFSAETIGI